MFTRVKQRHFYWFLSVRGTRACLRPSICDETFCGIFINSVQWFTKCCSPSFLKTLAVSHTPLQTLPYFPYFFTDLGQIWYGRSLRDAQWMWVSWKSAQRRQYFSYERQRTTFRVCRKTIWQLESKECLDKVSVLGHGVQHLQPSYIHHIYTLCVCCSQFLFVWICQK
jgi:hypothetical protein